MCLVTTVILVHSSQHKLTNINTFIWIESRTTFLSSSVKLPLSLAYFLFSSSTQTHCVESNTQQTYRCRAVLLLLLLLTRRPLLESSQLPSSSSLFLWQFIRLVFHIILQNFSPRLWVPFPLLSTTPPALYVVPYVSTYSSSCSCLFIIILMMLFLLSSSSPTLSLSSSWGGTPRFL